MNELFALIQDRWETLGTEPRIGVSATEFDSFERRHSVRLPTSVRSFYEFVNGMEEGQTDDELISFWSLARLDTVPALLSDFRGIPDYGAISDKLPESPSYFVFADYSIWCHIYAMRLTDDPGQPADVVWISGDLWYPLSSSFEAFLRSYAELPLNVLFPVELQNSQFQRKLRSLRDS
jgi:hypothetical protein